MCLWDPPGDAGRHEDTPDDPQVMGPRSHPHDRAGTSSNRSLDTIIDFVLVNFEFARQLLFYSLPLGSSYGSSRKPRSHLLHLRRIFTFDLLTFRLETLTASPEPMLHDKTCLITGALGVPTKIHARVDDDLLRGAICDRHCDLNSALLASLPMRAYGGL